MSEKKDDAPPTFVFKLDMHCDCRGCAKKIKKAVRGAEDFEVDRSANELTVIGIVDPAKVWDNLKKEFPKREVEIVSPQPEKDATAGNKKPDDKPEKEADRKESDDEKDQDEKPKEIEKKVEIVSPQPEKDATAGNKKPDDKPEKEADRKESDDEKDQDEKPKETEWIKAEKELQEEKELSQLLKPECDEIGQSAKRQVEEMERDLVNAFHAYTEIAKRECAKLKRLLEEDKKLARRHILEKDEELLLAKRQIEEIDKKLAHAKKDAELARKDADAAEEIIQVIVIRVEEISQELEETRNEAEHARNDADIAQNEWIKAKKDLQEELELIQMLKLECQETSKRATRQVEEIELELADTLNAVTYASSSSPADQNCAICLNNERDMAFGCGHMTCEECGKMLSTCPICREHITIRIKLFHG